MTRSASDAAFPWRQVVMAAFLPTILFSIGEGAILPIIPIVANELGADLAVAGLIAAMLVVGQLIGDIPAGALVARIRERAAMVGACAVSIAGTALAIFATAPWMLGLAILLIGLATAVFALARHAFMASYVPPAYRARALSTLGGTFRLGFLVGPFVTAGVIQATGSTVSAFWIHVGACLAAAVVLLVLADPGERAAAASKGAAASVPAPVAPSGLWRTLAANRRVLATLGAAASTVAALRSSRNIILPLWAVSIGLDAPTTALVIGVAATLDFALFYAGGWIMDRFGRLWTSVPSMLGLGLAHLILALTHDVPGTVVWFVVVAALLALANGIGSGILMTLGADLADPRNPAPFLGAWRFTNDAGAAAAPLLIAGVTAVASLPVAAAAMGVIGLLGAAGLRAFVPRASRSR